MMKHALSYQIRGCSVHAETNHFMLLFLFCRFREVYCSSTPRGVMLWLTSSLLLTGCSFSGRTGETHMRSNQLLPHGEISTAFEYLKLMVQLCRSIFKMVPKVICYSALNSSSLGFWSSAIHIHTHFLYTQSPHNLSSNRPPSVQRHTNIQYAFALMSPRPTKCPPPLFSQQYKNY